VKVPQLLSPPRQHIKGFLLEHNSGLKIMLNAHQLGSRVAIVAAWIVGAASPTYAGQDHQSNTAVVSNTAGARLSVDANGTIHLPPMDIPLSNLLSPSARAGLTQYFNFLTTPASNALGGASKADPEANRKALNEYMRPALERDRELYPTDQTPVTIAGVKADVFTPKTGVDPRNRNRVLIELHGGGFSEGAGTISALESIPVANLGGIKVIALDYRQGPEHKFPAASQDVVAVYRELLKTIKPRNVGIYGCSSGGLLTAEAVAWIEKEGLPAPGAIGIFCAGAGGVGDGDSGYLGTALIGWRILSPDKLSHSNWSYFEGADLSDPLVSPIRSRAVLAKFPPTLVITSTRDNAESSAVYTHAQLVKLGVDAELHVWEGQPHGFFTSDPDFPESKEAWDVVVRFFDKHLGTN